VGLSLVLLRICIEKDFSEKWKEIKFEIWGCPPSPLDGARE
jgi:hypothetical protein